MIFSTTVQSRMQRLDHLSVQGWEWLTHRLDAHLEEIVTEAVNAAGDEPGAQDFLDLIDDDQMQGVSINDLFTYHVWVEQLPRRTTL